ncbi:MAG: DUF998 domain-containing protein [Promethearchaeota archaeon]
MTEKSPCNGLFYNKIREIKTIYNNIEKYFLSSSTIKTSVFWAMLLYHLLLISGVIIAQWTPDWSAIDGYTIWNNWISDLGGGTYKTPHTPMPILYDLACVIAGALTMPLTFLLESMVAPAPVNASDLRQLSKWRLRLANLGFLFGLIGNFGYVGVGLFSEDRNYWGLHNIFSGLAFGGFVLCGLFNGLCILLYRTKIPKKFGLYMVIVPSLVLLLQGVSIPPYITGPFMEWMLLFSILGWVDPLSIITLIKIIKMDRSKNSQGNGLIESEDVYSSSSIQKQKRTGFRLIRRFLHGVLNFLKKLSDKIEDSWARKKNIRLYLFFILIGLNACLISSLILASISGYSILISDPWQLLSSSNHAHATFLYVAVCFIIGVCSFPIFFYLDKILAPFPLQEKDMLDFCRLKYKLPNYGLLFAGLGSISAILTGLAAIIFTSIPIRYTFIIEKLLTILMLISFSISIIFFSFDVLLFDSIFSRRLGLLGLIGCPTLLILWLFFFLEPIMGWVLYFFILGFGETTCIMVQKDQITVKQVKLK